MSGQTASAIEKPSATTDSHGITDQGAVSTDDSKKTTTDIEQPAPQGQEERNIIGFVQVLGSFVLCINTWGVVVSYGAFQTAYLQGILATSSNFQVAWIGSIQAFLLFTVSVFVGPLFDQGYLKLILYVGSFCSVLGLFMTSLCTELWQFFLAQGVCMGVGFGFLYLPGTALVSQHVRRHRALALSFTSVGGAIGGIIFPLILSHLISKIGLPWAIRVIAFITLILYIAPLLVLRYPEEAAQMMATTPPPQPADGRTGQVMLVGLHNYIQKLTDRSVLHDTPYVLLNLGLLTTFMGLYVIMYYVDLLAISRIHASADSASNMLIVLNASSVLSRLILALLADRLGPVYVTLACTACGVLLVFCLLAVASIPGLVVWTIAIGAVYGTFLGLIPAAIVSASNVSVAKIGARFGFSLAFVGGGVLISGPVAGAILGPHEARWAGLIAWSGSLLAVATLSFVATKVTKVGWSLKKQV